MGMRHPHCSHCRGPAGSPWRRATQVKCPDSSDEVTDRAGQTAVAARASPPVGSRWSRPTAPLASRSTRGHCACDRPWVSSDAGLTPRGSGTHHKRQAGPQTATLLDSRNEKVETILQSLYLTKFTPTSIYKCVSKTEQQAHKLLTQDL